MLAELQLTPRLPPVQLPTTVEGVEAAPAAVPVRRHVMSLAVLLCVPAGLTT